VGCRTICEHPQDQNEYANHAGVGRRMQSNDPHNYVLNLRPGGGLCHSDRRRPVLWGFGIQGFEIICSAAWGTATSTGRNKIRLAENSPSVLHGGCGAICPAGSSILPGETPTNAPRAPRVAQDAARRVASVSARHRGQPGPSGHRRSAPSLTCWQGMPLAPCSHRPSRAPQNR